MLMLCNSMTRRLEEFKPLEDGKVTVYTCGPSIYQLPHIGNYRTFLYEDVLLRYLEYLGYEVYRALFITDVEDKAIAEAQRERTSVRQLTEKNIALFFQELRQFRAKMPTHSARASTSVKEAVQLIESLIKKGYAYQYKGNVYYDPLEFNEFGKLFGLDMRRWPKQKRRYHKDTYPGNRWNLGDFILWHGYKPADKEAFWKTSLGKGRPAWNVQDPAMGLTAKGLRADIYCGGVDNMIRHHDYVIAIVEAVTGKPFARFWLHGEHLFVDGRKMSKSLDNIIYPKDLIEKGCAWQHIRFFLINGHYRKRLNFTFEKFKKACARLHEFKEIAKQFQEIRTDTSHSTLRAKKLVARLKSDFEANMGNDLHVKDAFDAVFSTVLKLKLLAERGAVSASDAKQVVSTLKRIDRVLQIIF